MKNKPKIENFDNFVETPEKSPNFFKRNFIFKN